MSDSWSEFLSITYLLHDRALVRPGRFDRIIAVPLPDIRGRVQILQHHMRNVTTSTGKLTDISIELVLCLPMSRILPDVDPKVIARGTPGFSGADLQNMVK